MAIGRTFKWLFALSRNRFAAIILSFLSFPVFTTLTLFILGLLFLLLSGALLQAAMQPGIGFGICLVAMLATMVLLLALALLLGFSAAAFLSSPLLVFIQSRVDRVLARLAREEAGSEPFRHAASLCAPIGIASIVSDVVIFGSLFAILQLTGRDLSANPAAQLAAAILIILLSIRVFPIVFTLVFSYLGIRARFGAFSLKRFALWLAAVLLTSLVDFLLSLALLAVFFVGRALLGEPNQLIAPAAAAVLLLALSLLFSVLYLLGKVE